MEITPPSERIELKASDPSAPATPRPQPKAVDPSEQGFSDAFGQALPELPEGFEPLAPQRPLMFWQHPMVQNVLPLATSLLIHLTIAVVGVILVVRAPQLFVPYTRQQLIVPDARIIEDAPVGGIPNPGLGEDPTRAAQQDQIQVQSSAEGWANKSSDRITQSLVAGGDNSAVDSVIGIGSNRSASGTGDPTGLGGSSGSAGGALAPFGPPGGGGGLGPRSPFMGISGNARRVIYIVDASGTMMSVFVHVREELKRAIDVLKPIQTFNVIFFKDADTIPLNKGAMIAATPDNKRKAFGFADGIAAAGGTDPIPAIRMAFAQKPNLIYILTDGFDNVDDFNTVVNEFRRLNSDKSVKVNTIWIKSSDAPELEKVLQKIADENGGRMISVDKSKF
jgi:hypothetical protein